MMAELPLNTCVGRSEPLADLRRRLLGCAMKLIWNRTDAEDIVQEALLLGLKKGIPLDEAGGSAWAWRTVCHLCLNHRRRRPIEPLETGHEMQSADAPSRRLEQQERWTRLRRELESLPPQQRLAITLRDMEALEYATAARIMELTESAVRTHVRLARRRLAERLTMQNGDA